MEYTGKQKYKNKPTVIDGIRFDSKKEAARYQELKLLEKINDIQNLKVHQRWPIIIGGIKVCDYVSDFEYYAFHPAGKKQIGEIAIQIYPGRKVVEDVKSPMTRKLPVYRLKKKLMLAVHGIEIREV